MNEILRVLDDQMLKWVAELDELYKGKGEIDNNIRQLKERIDKARELSELML